MGGREIQVELTIDYIWIYIWNLFTVHAETLSKNKHFYVVFFFQQENWNFVKFLSIQEE